MTPLELYLVQSSVSLVLLYSFYMILLRKETRHNWNRFYLLFAGIFSSLVPLLKLDFVATPYEKIFTVMLDPATTPGISAADKTANGFNLNIAEMLLYLYIGVLSLLLIRFLLRIINLYRLYINNKAGSLKGYTTIILEKETSPFSFFRIIFMPEEKLSDPALDKLIAHEEIHIKGYHSLDMLLFECLTILQWFNPAAWLCKKEIVAQHEFLADDAVIKKGISSVEYRNLLLAYSFNTGGASITNNFNSLLKRRLEMLSQKKITRNGKLKLLLSLPLLILIVFFLRASSGCTNMDAAVNNQDPVSVSASQKAALEKHGVIIINPAAKADVTSGDDPYTFVNQMPEYPEGQDALLKFIATNVEYPRLAKLANVQGKVIVSFIVEKDGSLSNVSIVKGIGSGCDEEALRVTKLMKKWIPGKQKGQDVRVQMAMPYSFKLQ